MEGELSLIGAFLTLVLVMVLAYWSSRFLSRRWNQTSRSGELKIAEQIQVGPDRRILLLCLREHNYLIGVSPAGIQLLAEVEGEFGESAGEGEPFKMAEFGKLLKKYASPHSQKKGEDK